MMHESNEPNLYVLRKIQRCIFFTHFTNETASICMELSNRSHSKNDTVTEVAMDCDCGQSQSSGLAAK